MDDTSPLATPPRRRFLQFLAVSATAIAAAAAAPGTAEAKRHPQAFRGVLVFRLTTRKHHSCNACKRHHRFMVFRSHALADAHRAHPGCNCPIIRHKLPVKQHRLLFGRRGLAPSGIADLRKTPLHGTIRASS